MNQRVGSLSMQCVAAGFPDHQSLRNTAVQVSDNGRPIAAHCHVLYGA
jgi:hypothetical protein